MLSRTSDCHIFKATGVVMSSDFSCSVDLSVISIRDLLHIQANIKMYPIKIPMNFSRL